MIFKAVHIVGCIKKLNKYIKPEVYLNVNINNKVCPSFTIFRLSSHKLLLEGVAGRFPNLIISSGSVLYVIVMI